MSISLDLTLGYSLTRYLHLVLEIGHHAVILVTNDLTFQLR
jgi:hypothetical protein